MPHEFVRFLHGFIPHGLPEGGDFCLSRIQQCNFFVASTLPGTWYNVQ